MELQVAFAWASSIEPEEGTQLLIKLGLLDSAIEYALESRAFAQAFQLCQAPAAQHKMPECHLKYAMYLEDEGAPSALNACTRCCVFMLSMFVYIVMLHYTYTDEQDYTYAHVLVVLHDSGMSCTCKQYCRHFILHLQVAVGPRLLPGHWCVCECVFVCLCVDSSACGGVPTTSQMVACPFLLAASRCLAVRAVTCATPL